MNKEEAKETKGLLLIDGAYNTLLIPMGSDDMKELMENFIHKNIKYVRKNKTKSDLNRSVREYLAKEYVNKERDDR
ncbi:MAG: hypothetical protein J6T10_22310 [Methanobrevibacter sp.]|nr:hypothetical protein [Methanobrevibacter sp.]